MKGFVYVLKNDKGDFYIGSTDNLRRRLNQHRIGHTQTTRNQKMINLVLVQEYGSLKDARIVERKIKKLKRKDYIAKMVADGYIKVKSG